MNEVSFTSAITPVNQVQLAKKIANLDKKAFVAFPWTIQDSVKAASAGTTRVCDCSVMGITDGTDVFLMHLSPEYELNHSTYFIRQFIAKNVDLFNKNLQAILIGSKPTKKSQDVYNKLLMVLHEFKIPFSELKHAKDATNVFYSSVNDEWLISSQCIDRAIKQGKTSEEILKNTFNTVNISPLDYIG